LAFLTYSLKQNFARLMVISRNVWKLITFTRKLFIKNIVYLAKNIPVPNYIDQLGAWRSTVNPNGIRGGAQEALAVRAFSLTKDVFCKLS